MEKLKKFLLRNVGFLVVTITSGVYLATSFFFLDNTGKTIWQVVADGAVIYFIGLFLNRFFGLQGILLGEDDPRVVATQKLHAEAVMRISPFMGNLDGWCARKNEENLKTQRTRLLATQGMYYGDFFDEKGGSKEFAFREAMMKHHKTRRMEHKRFRCYEKAATMKLSQVSSSNLTSEGGRADDPYNFGRTKMEYERGAAAKDAVSKIVFAIVFGLFVVQPLSEFSFEELIWKGLQIGIFLLIGITTMYRSRFFVTEEYRGRLVKKIDCLQMFENDMNIQTKEANNNDCQ